MFTKRIAAAVAGATLASSVLLTPLADASAPAPTSDALSDDLTNEAAENYVAGRTSDGRDCVIPASVFGSAAPALGSAAPALGSALGSADASGSDLGAAGSALGSALGSAALGSAALGSALGSSDLSAAGSGQGSVRGEVDSDGTTNDTAAGSSVLVEAVACHPVSGSSLLAPLAGSALIGGLASSALTSSALGSSALGSSALGSSALGSSALGSSAGGSSGLDKCFQQNERTEEKVVGTRTVVKDVTREGDWRVGDIKGAEGWTFHKPEGSDKTVSATIPAGTPAGEYPATIYHFSYNKNQISENVTFHVVEEEVKESRKWTELEEISCAVPLALAGLIPGALAGGSSQAGSAQPGELPGGPRGEVPGDFVDHKVLAQQQAGNAAAGNAAAAAPATQEVTPEHSAQETQLANNGIGGTLLALAVALLAAFAGAGVLLKRRTN